MAKQAIDTSTKEMELGIKYEALDEVDSLIEKIVAVSEGWYKEWLALQAKKTELESQGVDYAGTTWKDGKYLYLVYPAAHGMPRKRVYIGQEKEKCEAALAKLRRGHELEEVKLKINSLDHRVKNMIYYMKMAVR